MKKAIKRENPVTPDPTRKEIQTHQRSKKEWNNRIKISIKDLEKAEKAWQEAKEVYLEAKRQVFWARNSLVAETLSYYFEFNRKTGR